MNLMERIITSSGFELFPDQGFISGRRGHDVLSLFTWGNARHAEASIIPRSYVVIQYRGRRWRLPKVEWEPFMPISRQAARQTQEILDEFAAVFGPILGSSQEPAVTARHDMQDSLDVAVNGAGLTRRGYISPKSRVIGPDSREWRVYAEGKDELSIVLADPKTGTERRLPAAGTDWASVTEWLRSETGPEA